MIRSIMIILLISFILFPLSISAEEMPDIYGKYGVAINASTGEIIYEKNAKEKAYPASITKVMTAILLEENVADGEMIVASEWAAGQEASQWHFKLTPNEVISKKDALYALMVISANDVSVAIAEHIAGSQEEFGKLMTEKAKEIGALNTNFITSSGLHHPAHYTTAYDMALIAREALKYPNIVDAMGTKSITLKTDKKEKEVTNPSKIHDNPLALGGKTGYTNAAQNTLMEVLEKDGKTIVAVVMKTTLSQEYNDIEIMSDYSFKGLESIKLITKNESMGKMMVSNEEIELLANRDFVITYKKDEKGKFEKNIKLNKEEIVSVKRGEVVGNIEISKDGTIIKKIPLISDRTVEKLVQKKGPISLKNLLISIVIPIVFYIFYIFYYNLRMKKESSRQINNKDVI